MDKFRKISVYVIAVLAVFFAQITPFWAYAEDPMTDNSVSTDEDANRAELEAYTSTPGDDETSLSEAANERDQSQRVVDGVRDEVNEQQFVVDELERRAAESDAAIHGYEVSKQELDRLYEDEEIDQETYNQLNAEYLSNLQQLERQSDDISRQINSESQRLSVLKDQLSEAEQILSDAEQQYQDALRKSLDTQTVLPQTVHDTISCQEIMDYVNFDAPGVRKTLFEGGGDGLEIADTMVLGENITVTANDIMGCAIKTGDVKLWMVPYYIKYILQFILSMAGLITVGGFVYGGYLYLFAGVSEDKEKGKKALTYSVAGFVLTMLAWGFVNIIISLLTG